MPHRSPKKSSLQPPQPLSQQAHRNPPLPRRSSTTRTEGAGSDETSEPLISPEISTHAPLSPRWEQRYRAPSQREPLPREHHDPHELDARRTARWNMPHNAPESSPEQVENVGEAVGVTGEATTTFNAPHPQWSKAELEDLAHETMAHRGRKLSRRRARKLAARARRRHVDARRTEPHPKTRRPPVWRFFRAVALCLAAVSCLEIAAAALTSPRFAVQEVTSDVVDITPEVDIEQAKAELMGHNFFRVRPQSALRKLAALPTVKTVSVTHQIDWPPRLHMNIEEREPFARVDGNDQWWVVDQEGVPFRPATPKDDKLYAVSSKALTPRLGVKLKAENWTPVVEFAQTLQQDKQQGHDWALRAIYFDEHGFASLRLAEAPDSPDRTLVHLGTGPWDKKLERTRQALSWLETKGLHAETLNLISLKRPVWTPRLPKPAQNTATGEARSHDHPA